jgi:hypothetical protein
MIPDEACHPFHVKAATDCHGNAATIEAGQIETITTTGQGRGKTQDLTPALRSKFIISHS